MKRILGQQTTTKEGEKKNQGDHVSLYIMGPMSSLLLSLAALISLEKRTKMLVLFYTSTKNDSRTMI